MMGYLTTVLDWIGAHAAWAGPVVFLVALSESLALVGLIMPGAVLLFGFGALIGSGRLEFWPIMLWAIAGAIAGDGLSYLLGRWLGPRLGDMWPFRQRPELLRNGVEFFQRHGAKSVVLGRFVGPLRPIIPAVAGMLRMSALRFFITNVLSAVAWAPAYLLPGMVLVASLGMAAAVAGRLVVLVLLGMLACWFLISGLRRLPSRTRWLAAVATALIGAIVLTQLDVWSPPLEVRALTRERWQQDPWGLSPALRRGVWQAEEPFAFQAAAHPLELERALVRGGWQVPEPFDLRGALLWLSPQVDLVRVPPLPRRHAGRAPTIVRVRYFEGDRLVLRIWRTSLVLQGSGRPIWLASVEREALDPAWPWLRRRLLPVPDEAVAALEQALLRQLPAGYYIEAP
jgi:membrane protein DedA with SNARE-associated domain